MGTAIVWGTLCPPSLEAQTATIRGVVGDSVSGLPVPGVLIKLDGLGMAAETDPSGSFVLHSVTAGAHTIQLTALGFTERLLRFDLNPQLGDTQDVGLVLLTPLPPVTIRVRGTVRDTSLSAPVTRARVSLAGLASANVDSSGRFALPAVRVRPGHYTLLVRAIGYYPTTLLVTAAQGGTIDVDAPLTRIPFLLSDIEVTAEAIQRARLREFYFRAETGLGDYFTPSAVDSMRHRVARPSDLLSRIPGITLRPTRFGNRLEFLSCGDPVYVLDGILLHGGLTFDELVGLEEIAALEVYRRASQVPLEYATLQSRRNLRPACGAIVIWTR